MVNFTVNVVSENEDKRVPVEIAGKMMVDIQHLLMHVGEYLMSKELRIQGKLEPRLSNKFTLFVDSSGSISLNASSYVPETKGYGNIVDDAVTFMERTLDALGAGTGGYWMEDNYANAIFRNQVIYDVVKLYEDLNEVPGYALMYGSSDCLKKLGKVDTDKMAHFVEDRGLTANGATLGLIGEIASKSKGSILTFNTGTRDIKISFESEESRKAAEIFVDGEPVVIAGKLIYSEDEQLAKIENAGGVTPIPVIKFTRMISATGDVELKAAVEATVKHAKNKWTLTNEDLGIEVSKPEWDTAVQQFHDYFVFLWTEYSEKKDEDLSEEEKEVKDSLLKLVA